MTELEFYCDIDPDVTVNVDYFKKSGVGFTVYDASEESELTIYLDADDVATLAGYLSALVEQEWRFKDG